MTEETIKMRAGDYRIPVKTWVEGTDRFFDFPFNRTLMAEIKVMEGSKYHGYDSVKPRKVWSAKNSQRNRFQLDYLCYNSNDPATRNPYARYDEPLDATIALIPTTRFNHQKQTTCTLFNHQPEGTAHILVRKQCIVAGEMGTCKTLMVMIAMEMASKPFKQVPEWYYVAPRSALASVQRDWRIWGGFITPKWFTYEGMTKAMREWQQGKRAPFGVIFDESSKLKNYTAQRTQAAKALAEGIRNDWGDDGFVVLMSGSPAPKSPADWWSQAEIACPGFLREGDIHKFKQRMGIIIQKEGIDGGSYPQLITWRDDENKCNICGLLADADVHQVDLALTARTHDFIKSENEVAKLYKRLSGLVVVYFKKNCLDLPDKHYKVIECKPKPSTLRAAQLVLKASKTVISGLTLLRELSDGFQYYEEPVGKEECPLCHGSEKVLQPEEIPGTCPNCKDQDSTFVCGNHTPEMKMVETPCPTCGGMGQVTKFIRAVREVPCPKEDALVEVLDEHDDVGRIVIYAGFTGSIDRCVKACHRQKWATIRIDQGAVRITDSDGAPIQDKDYLKIFQDEKDKYSKVAVVAHPGSAGMGLTLTASPTILYYSNTFNAEERIQSEDRIHRPGMDLQKGATIIDLVHLPSDLKILDNLRKKRDLQALTLGDFQSVIAEAGERPD